MDVTGRRADVFADAGQKGDNVVPHFPFDFINAIDIEIGFLLDILQGRSRDFSALSKGFASQDFNFKPNAEFVLWFPDGGHLGQSVTRDHYFPLELGECYNVESGVYINHKSG